MCVLYIWNMYARIIWQNVLLFRVIFLLFALCFVVFFYFHFFKRLVGTLKQPFASSHSAPWPPFIYVELEKFTIHTIWKCKHFSLIYGASATQMSVSLEWLNSKLYMFDWVYGVYAFYMKHIMYGLRQLLYHTYTRRILFVTVEIQ